MKALPLRGCPAFPRVNQRRGLARLIEMQDAVGNVLSPLVLVAAWLISPLAWSQHSPTEIQAVIARGELGELQRPRFPGYRSELERFYGPIAYQPAWFDGDAPRKQANDAVNLLADAKTEGLDPADYGQCRVDVGLLARRQTRPARHNEPCLQPRRIEHSLLAHDL